jgi:hypothetical protein
MTHDTSQEVAQQMAEKQRQDEERARAEMQAQGTQATEGSSYQDQTVAELKDELAERDLPKSGKKDDLVARLEEDDQQGSTQQDQPQEEEKQG